MSTYERTLFTPLCRTHLHQFSQSQVALSTKAGKTLEVIFLSYNSPLWSTGISNLYLESIRVVA